MFWSKNKKNRFTPTYPSWLYKSGVQGVYITQKYYPDDTLHTALQRIVWSLINMTFEPLRGKFNNVVSEQV